MWFFYNSVAQGTETPSTRLNNTELLCRILFFGQEGILIQNFCFNHWLMFLFNSMLYNERERTSYIIKFYIITKSVPWKYDFCCVLQGSGFGFCFVCAFFPPMLAKSVYRLNPVCKTTMWWGLAMFESSVYENMLIQGEKGRKVALI